MEQNYRIEVPGKRTRRATSQRRAEVALGQLLDTAGTVGVIRHHGQPVVVALGTGLGWQRVEAMFAPVA